MNIFKLLIENMRSLWTMDSGFRTGRIARNPSSSNRVLFSGTVCGALVLIALTSLLPETPPSAEAVGLMPVSDFVMIDPDLILAPDPGKLGNSPLALRALALADNPKVKVQLEHLLIDKRDIILDALALSTRYIPHIAPILEKYNLPPETNNRPEAMPARWVCGR